MPETTETTETKRQTVKGRGLKISNEYAQAFGRLYTDTPKAIFAAVAFSYATWAAGNEAKDSKEAVSRFITEWRILHENGIVSQRPPVLEDTNGNTNNRD